MFKPVKEEEDGLNGKHSMRTRRTRGSVCSNDVICPKLIFLFLFTVFCNALKSPLNSTLNKIVGKYFIINVLTLLEMDPKVE